MNGNKRAQRSGCNQKQKIISIPFSNGVRLQNRGEWPWTGLGPSTPQTPVTEIAPSHPPPPLPRLPQPTWNCSSSADKGSGNGLEGGELISSQQTEQERDYSHCRSWWHVMIKAKPAPGSSVLLHLHRHGRTGDLLFFLQGPVTIQNRVGLKKPPKLHLAHPPPCLDWITSWLSASCGSWPHCSGGVGYTEGWAVQQSTQPSVSVLLPVYSERLTWAF